MAETLNRDTDEVNPDADKWTVDPADLDAGRIADPAKAELMARDDLAGRIETNVADKWNDPNYTQVSESARKRLNTIYDGISEKYDAAKDRVDSMDEAPQVGSGDGLVTDTALAEEMAYRGDALETMNAGAQEKARQDLADGNLETAHMRANYTPARKELLDKVYDEMSQRS